MTHPRAVQPAVARSDECLVKLIVQQLRHSKN